MDLLYPSVAQEIASLVMDCLNVAAISSDKYVVEGQSKGNTTLLLKKFLFVMKLIILQTESMEHCYLSLTGQKVGRWGGSLGPSLNH